MSIIHVLAFALLIVSVVFAVIKQGTSPTYFAVLSGVVLYVLSGLRL